MPRYEFFCNDCKKLFSTVLSLVDYAAGEVLCPRCGSHDIEQCWSAFSAITRRRAPDDRICGPLHQSWAIDTPGKPGVGWSYPITLVVAARSARRSFHLPLTNRKERIQCIRELLN